jgi:hypothetical protein
MKLKKSPSLGKIPIRLGIIRVIEVKMIDPNKEINITPKDSFISSLSRPIKIAGKNIINPEVNCVKGRISENDT